MSDEMTRLGATRCGCLLVTDTRRISDPLRTRDGMECVGCGARVPSPELRLRQIARQQRHWCGLLDIWRRQGLRPHRRLRGPWPRP